MLLRRKFFTAISLFGISFTLLVLMLAAALLDHILAAQPPESRSDRILAISSGSPARSRRRQRQRAWVTRCWTASPATCPAPSGCRSSCATGWSPRTATASAPDRSSERTDAEFWKILDFDFLEGGPFSEEDVREARFVAVINERTRERLLRRRAGAWAQTMRAGGQRFRVVGVVPDVPRGRRNA